MYFWCISTWDQPDTWQQHLSSKMEPDSAARKKTLKSSSHWARRVLKSCVYTCVHFLSTVTVQRFLPAGDVTICVDTSKDFKMIEILSQGSFLGTICRMRPQYYFTKESLWSSRVFTKWHRLLLLRSSGKTHQKKKYIGVRMMSLTPA